MAKTPKVKVKQVKPYRLYHVQYETQHDLCMAFVRLQEFYESPNPKFRGHHFTFEEYVDWYCQTQGKGDFTYCTDWSGFNVPGNVVQDFAIEIDDLGEIRWREEALFDALACVDIDVLDDEYAEPFYVIGTTMDVDLDTMEHEVAHGIFYLDEEYCKAVTKAVKKYKLAGLKAQLKKLGYDKSVFIDECHAYVLTGLAHGMKETQEIKKLRKELKAIYEEHVKLK